MTVGELMGFVFFFTFLYEPVSKLHRLNQMMQAARLLSVYMYITTSQSSFSSIFVT